jgi:signal peptidase I
MKRSYRDLWQEWRGFLVFVLLLVVFRSGVADWYQVPSGSMKPTLLEGDRILVNRLAYDVKVPFTDLSLWHTDEPKRGDVVVFSSPRDGMRLVKRLVGLPGDVISMRANRLYVNGEEAVYEPLREVSLYENLNEGQLVVEESVETMVHPAAVSVVAGSPLSSFGPITVPEGHYFMLGDNRDYSADSRVIGPVPRALLNGRVERILVSLNSDDWYLPRSGRFWSQPL